MRTPAQKAERDILAFKIVWDGISAGATQPGELLNEYYESRKKLSADHTFEAYDKARTTFAAFYDAFHAHMRSHTNGFWGDYSFKILLDVACYISLPSMKDSDNSSSSNNSSSNNQRSNRRSSPKPQALPARGRPRVVYVFLLSIADRWRSTASGYCDE